MCVRVVVVGVRFCGGVCAVCLCCFGVVLRLFFVGFVFGLFLGWSLKLDALLIYMVSGNGPLTWSLVLVSEAVGLLSCFGLRGCRPTGAK